MVERFTIAAAAEYWKTSKASQAFLLFLGLVRQIFSFTHERANRLQRCVQILTLYAKGTPVKDIAARYECSTHTVLRYARAAALNKRSKRSIPERTREAAMMLYEQGVSIAEISARLGVSQAWLSHEARQRGISRYASRPKSKSPGRHAKK